MDEFHEHRGPGDDERFDTYFGWITLAMMISSAVVWLIGFMLPMKQSQLNDLIVGAPMGCWLILHWKLIGRPRMPSSVEGMLMIIGSFILAGMLHGKSVVHTGDVVAQVGGIALASLIVHYRNLWPMIFFLVASDIVEHAFLGLFFITVAMTIGAVLGLMLHDWVRRRAEHGSHHPS